MTAMKINWEKQFDAVYCLSLADNVDKRTMMEKEFRRIGIAPSMIRWKITVRNPFYRYIWTNPQLPAERWWLNIEGALNCTMGHYEIMTECRVLGYERVLIVEDDVRFLKDTNALKEIIDNIPPHDICLFDKNIPLMKSKKVYKQTVRESENPLFIDFANVKLWGTGCLSLSRHAMEVLTDSLERLWSPIDNHTNRVDNGGRVINDDGLIRVASIKNACVQDMSLKPQKGNYDDIIYNDVADLEEYI